MQRELEKCGLCCDEVRTIITEILLKELNDQCAHLAKSGWWQSPALCMSGAVLLKECNKDMSALHQLVGIYLFHGDLHKSVSNRS